MTEGIGKALANAIKEPAATGAEKRGRHIFWNQHRRDVFSLLTKTPFVSAATIAAGLGLSGNTVKWHLSCLAKAGYVAGYSAGKQTLFFPEGLVGQQDAALFGSVNHPRRGEIYRKVLRNPGISQSDIVAAGGESRQTVAGVLADMEALGLLTTTKDGARNRYYPTRLLPDRADGFFKHSRVFSDYILKRLEKEGGKSPEVVKRGLEGILVEMGYASDRFAMEIGVNPFMTCGVC